MKPYWKQDNNIIYQGHVLEVLKGMADESVQMCVTSPPYWGLRDYGLEPQIWDGDENCRHEWGDELISQANDSNRGTMEWTTGGNPAAKVKGKKSSQGQFCHLCNAWRGSLGLEPTPELFIDHIVQIFREIKRVLRKDGTVFLNLGDSYASSGKGNDGNEGYNDGRKNRSSRLGGRSVPGLKPKDLIGIPWRVALALQADGWWLRSAMPWVKRSAMPESVNDRPASALEYMFLLTKSGKTQYWTHRDRGGTRKRPAVDYRWINQVDQSEASTPPADWKLKIICPECKGIGMADFDMSYEFMGEMIEYHQSEKCPVCDGKKKVQKWKRVNLWIGHDYYFDMDSIRKENKPESKKRALRGVSETNKYAKGSEKPPGVHANTMSQGREYKGYENMDAEIEGGNTTLNPEGRNFRNTDLFFQSIEPPHGMIFCGDEPVGLDVNPQAMKEAHFATFPEKLIEPCVLAGTSEKGCCVECGAPWERVREPNTGGTTGKSWHPHEDDLGVGNVKRQTGSEFKTYKPGKTIGWKPGCECDTPATRDWILAGRGDYCIILDPFFGSGTTGLVAHKHGRNFIGIDLGADYLKDIAVPRIEKVTKQLKLFN